MPASNTIDNHYDVLVVGLGPSGATLALLLAQSGLKVLVIEKESEIYSLPRAVHFDDETMRIFQTVGIASKLFEKIRINPGMRFIDEHGRILLDWPRPQSLTAQGWHGSYRLHQPDLEQLLREALLKNEHCQVLLERELVGFEQTGSAVEVVFKETNSDLQFSTSATYLVGCDGANSTTRKLLGAQWKDLGFKERWLVVDVLLKRDLPELGDYTIQHCHAETPMTYCRNPGRRRRWEMALNADLSNEEALSSEFIWHKLSRWIDRSDAELERQAVYQFRSAIADRWQQQRILLVGDAVHLTPPFMGQGMCAGIRDAYNLAWKIELSVKRRLDRALLSTYQLEREGHVRQYITKAIELGELINAMDRHGVNYSEQPGSRKMAFTSPTLSGGIEKMFAVQASKHTGTLFGQPVLADGVSMDDKVGYKPVLISRQPHHGSKAPGAAVLELNANDHPALENTLDELGCEAVLLRPDRYILTTASTVDEISVLRSVASRLWSSPASPD